ncbi:MAG: energy transducer TonB [Candidatus Acidiferrales bacterium]
MMIYRRAMGIPIVSLLSILPTAPAFAQQLPPSHPASAAQEAPTALPATAIPSYPDSPGGLQKLFKKMLQLQKNGDENALAPYIQSLILPNSDAWFRSTFGNDIGAALDSDYERTRAELPMSFPDTLADLLAKYHTSPEAMRFTDSCNSHASETEYPILLLRMNAQTLYDVRFEDGIRLNLIPYFAYVDGAFRYLGNFQVRTQNFPSKRVDVKRIRVGGNVIKARLIHQTMPVYPERAKEQGMQGTVLLHALIGTDGRVHDLQVMKGQCWLAQSAVKAVSQWRYRPTMLAGNPVQVDTTITVIFNLGFGP